MGRPDREAAWCLVREDRDERRDRHYGSAFAVANGLVGVRGTPIERSATAPPGTYAAGVYDCGPEPGAVPELVCLPDWLDIALVVEGARWHPSEAEVLECRRTLDLRRAVLHERLRLRDGAGRVTAVEAWRLASLADRHALLLRIRITAENHDGWLELDTGLDGTVRNLGGTIHYDPIAAEPLGAAGCLLAVRMRASGLLVAEAAACRLAGVRGEAAFHADRHHPLVRWRWRARAPRSRRSPWPPPARARPRRPWPRSPSSSGSRASAGTASSTRSWPSSRGPARRARPSGSGSRSPRSASRSGRRSSAGAWSAPGATGGRGWA